MVMCGGLLLWQRRRRRGAVAPRPPAAGAQGLLAKTSEISDERQARQSLAAVLTRAIRTISEVYSGNPWKRNNLPGFRKPEGSFPLPLTRLIPASSRWAVARNSAGEKPLTNAPRL